MLWVCTCKDQIHFSSTESYINVNGYKISSSKISERSREWRWLQQPPLRGGWGGLQQNSMEKYSFSRVSRIHKYSALSPLQACLPLKLLPSTSLVGEIYQPPNRSPETLLPITVPLPLRSRPRPRSSRALLAWGRASGCAHGASNQLRPPLTVWTTPG